jgi:hypothetical protein
VETLAARFSLVSLITDHSDIRMIARCNSSRNEKLEVATVAANVTVAARAPTATFTVTTKSVATSSAVTISATKGGTSTAILTVTP